MKNLTTKKESSSVRVMCHYTLDIHVILGGN